VPALTLRSVARSVDRGSECARRTLQSASRQDAPGESSCQRGQQGEHDWRWRPAATGCCYILLHRGRVAWHAQPVAIYEYLVMVSIYSNITTHTASGVSLTDYSTAYQLWAPKATQAELRSDTSLVILLNELGQAGWRLVTCDLLDSAISPGLRHGWSEAAVPIRQRWTFVRES
jgi:hypothetical protein